MHSIVPDLDCVDGDDNSCDSTEWQRFIQKTTKTFKLKFLSWPHLKASSLTETPPHTVWVVMYYCSYYFPVWNVCGKITAPLLGHQVTRYEYIPVIVVFYECYISMINASWVFDHERLVRWCVTLEPWKLSAFKFSQSAVNVVIAILLYYLLHITIKHHLEASLNTWDKC